ncbi:hypothetical protein [Streptomyces sp. AF1A]|uniref:hypothetical protein n=1 Tax=Streptomyces sp. AF1A TaxID=3394350 RepID=UPI0039BC2EE7
MTAVVRSSTGEAVILLSGDPLRQVPESTLTDMLNAAAAVLDAAELHLVNNTVPALHTGAPDFLAHIGQDELAVYKLTVN